MSKAPWSTTKEAQPHGFRVTIERRNRATGKAELHIFPSKTANRSIAQKAAAYKCGFIRLVGVLPLARDQWDREFGAATRAHARDRAPDRKVVAR